MIETDRLILRPWTDADAEALFRYASDPDVGPAAGWAPHTSVRNSLEIIHTEFSAPEVYAVVLKETGEPAGCAGIMFAENPSETVMDSDEAEIGYWMGKPYWGRGLMPEAVKALIDRCFNGLGLNTVWCSHYDGNKKSQRVIEKCGFAYDHTEHNLKTLLGDERSAHFYKMTSQDYRKQR